MAKRTESWRPIPGYEGHYEVSDLGNVVSLKWGMRRPLKASPNGRGYPAIALVKDQRQVTKMVHGLVMAAFVGPLPPGQEVRHLDGDSTNNHLSNLAYGTHRENVRDAVRHGTNRNAAKTHCPRQHPYDEANTRVDKRGRRACRTCQRDDMRRRRAVAQTGEGHRP